MRMNKLTKYKKLTYCSNCGCTTHSYKNCDDAITSYGVINVCIDMAENQDVINKIKAGDHTSPLSGIRYENDYIKSFCNIGQKLKFLMIRRKFSLGYIEFVRGRYYTDDACGILDLFEQMVPEEISTIGLSSFDDLWNNLWKNSKNNNHHKSEYNMSKKKFNTLKACTKAINLMWFVNNTKTNLKHAEWGFPKGRKNYKENDYSCALREFHEETGFKENEYDIVHGMGPFIEKFKGTNGKNYRHVYYVGLSNNTLHSKIDPTNISQCTEIGDIGWFSYDDAIKKIRSRHTERVKIITNIYCQLINKSTH